MYTSVCMRMIYECRIVTALRTAMNIKNIFLVIENVNLEYCGGLVIRTHNRSITVFHWSLCLK